MKPLVEFTNEDKAKMLHALFPEEIPLLLDEILAFCEDFKRHKEEYAKDWPTNSFFPFDYWFSLSEETATLIKGYRIDMIRSRIVFSSQLCYTYTVLFLNDRIIKYSQNKTTNEKFKKAVELLYI